MEKANITLYQKTDYANKKGEYPIYIRTIINRKATYYKTIISLKKDDWDKINKKVIRHKDKSLLNSSLQKQLSEFETSYLTAHLTDTVFSGKNKKVDFFEYTGKYLQQMERIKGKEKMKFKRSTLAKFKSFKTSLTFGQITPKLMKEYEQFLRDKGNVDNTIWSSIKDVRSIINQALKEGTIKTNPLHGYEVPKYEDPERDYLNEDQLKILDDYSLDTENPKTLRDVATWFLFGAYSGLRYSDMVNFSKSKIRDGRIILRTEKTGTDVSIKIHSRLQEIINRLPNKIFTNQRMNTYLITVSKICKLPKITMHTSRHSFAVNFLTRGGSIEGLSKILGHTDLKTTAIYAKIVNKRLDNEIDLVWN